MSNNFKYVQTGAMTLYGAGAALGATSLRVIGMTDLNGVKLTMADFGVLGYGSIEPGTSGQEEPITFSGITDNGDGTQTLTGIKTQIGKSPYTQTSGLAISHAGGTTFVVSNTAGFYANFANTGNDETISGVYTFTSPSYPRMDSASTPPSNDAEFATKKYIDDVAIAGSPKATNTVYGIAKLSAAAISSTQPIVVGDNDPRLPNQNENDALAGTSGAPSSVNKYVTNADTSTTVVTLKAVRWDENNKLHASSTTLATVAGDVVALDSNAKLPAVDGSRLTVIGDAYVTTFTKQISDASTTQTITHNLGRMPKLIKAYYHGWTTGSGFKMNTGAYSVKGSNYAGIIGANVDTANTTSLIYINNATGSQTGVINSVSSTNIIIGWTRGGNEASTVDISIEII